MAEGQKGGRAEGAKGAKYYSRQETRIILHSSLRLERAGPNFVCKFASQIEIEIW